ncbi:nuclear transport factor 2 family protein [Dietzia psychralcaliphila]|uniref:nuclear transport factor 2 family protein n=1 Tax=Dietzia psychralcaliphila TaxID=139021 RepID=UPI001C1E0A3A|nr:nuclear transport factor 2 family protein [Dietzia psychralcaliphila]
MTEAPQDRNTSRNALTELGARYCIGVDRRDPEIFLPIWTADGEYIVGRRAGRFRGTDELKTALNFVAEAYASTRHWTTNHLIEFQSDTEATGLSDSFALCVTYDDQPCLVAASYDDRYSFQDGQWLIQKREVTRWFVSEPMNLGLTYPSRPTADEN